MTRLWTLIQLACIVIIASTSISAYTDQGTISSDETWGSVGDTIKVRGNITVTSGATLTIEPGVYIRGFSGTSAAAYNININGTGAIHAVGTETDSIDFRTVRVEFQNLTRDDANRLEYCKFASGWGHALVEFRNTSTPATEDVLSHVTIKNSAFYEGGYAQVYITSGASPTFENCYFNNTGTAIFSHGSDTLTVRNCSFENMGCAIVVGSLGGRFYEPMVCHIGHCTFNNINNSESVPTYLKPSQGMAIFSLNEPGVLNVKNCIFYDIAGSGIRDYNIEDANFSENWDITNDYNIFYLTGGDPCHLFDMGTNSLEADPLLGSGPEFSLGSDSPASDAADDGTNMGAWQGSSNSSPMITSIAVNTVFEDSIYSYTVTATDVDSADNLVYSLSIAPAGMVIDSLSGAITWVPDNDDVGRQTVKVSASDNNGGADSQQFTLTVVNTNDPVSIASSPVTIAHEDRLYVYSVTVNDVDTGDSHRFALLNAVSGMVIDSISGLIRWTPVQAQVGTESTHVSVRDAAGTADTQHFAITVSAVNDAPVISAASRDTSDEDAEFSMIFTATDEENDTLSFSLSNEPFGMVIDRRSGAVVWTPDNDDVGDEIFSVTVDDGNGGSDTRVFTLTVRNTNDPPRITSLPDTVVDEDASYTYALTVADDDADDTVEYSLVSVPTGMSVDGDGAVSWVPGSNDIGVNSIILSISDMAGVADTQVFNITVNHVNHTPGTPDIIKPSGVAQMNRHDTLVWSCYEIDAGDTVTYTLEISDNSLFTSLEVLAFGLKDSVLELNDLAQIDNLEDNKVYYVRVKAADQTGAESFYSVHKVFVYNQGSSIQCVPGVMGAAATEAMLRDMNGRAVSGKAAGVYFVKIGDAYRKVLVLNK